MTPTLFEFQGYQPGFDRFHRRTSVTQPFVITISTNMDQKELEDRMAAAEALSSLGLPLSFEDSNPAEIPVAAEEQQTKRTTKEKPPKVRSKARAKVKNEQDTGRETKSRSTRGRGRGRSTSNSTSRNLPLVTTTDFVSVGQIENPFKHTMTTVATLNTHHLQTPKTKQPRRRGGTKNKQNPLSVVDTQISNATPSVAVRNASSNVQFSSASDSNHSQGCFIPIVSMAKGKVDFAQFTQRSNIQLHVPTAGVSSSTVEPMVTLTSSLPRTPVTAVSSQQELTSSTNLPSLSLNSAGLSNLPSIPNLPSLPSAIASLQLDSSGLSSGSIGLYLDGGTLSPHSQLSPHGRDGDEKSLPLKKRRIFDSTSVTSPAMSPDILVSAPPVTTVTHSPSASTQAITIPATPDVASENKTVPVGGTLPALLLSQVLPPAVSMQLLSEVNTAITPDEDGDLPLHIAVVHENEAMVKKLIQLMALAGRKVDRYNKQQQTPLHLAIKLAFLPAIQMLLEEGSDPNLVDSTGSTSIHMAVQGRDSDCLEALLQWSKFECDLNYRNFEGLAPLHTAIINNDLELVKTLLDHGADVNIMDGKSGRTVLFHAAESNQRTAVDLLLRRGADPEIANYAGVIPSMAAQGRSHTHVARMLARAVDENPDDTGGEDGEVLSPANMEIVISDESSDSSRLSASDKIKASALGSATQLQARLTNVRTLNKVQTQSSIEPPKDAVENVKAMSKLQLPPFIPSASVVQCAENGNGDSSAKQLVKLETKASENVEMNSGDERKVPCEPAASETKSLTSTPALHTSLAKTLIQNLIWKAIVEKQNSKEPVGGNLTQQFNLAGAPLPARIVTATVSAPSNTTSIPATGMPKVISVPFSNTLGTPSIPISGVTIPQTSVDLSKISVVSTVHSQSTRPLLLFRSSSMDPGSGDGRRTGSVELRHFTPDALMALQQSATNSVNPNLKSAPANFQQLRNFLASTSITVPRAEVLMETGLGHPVSSCMPATDSQKTKICFSPEETADQPRDYSLKSRKKCGQSEILGSKQPYSGKIEPLLLNSLKGKTVCGSATNKKSVPLIQRQLSDNNNQEKTIHDNRKMYESLAGKDSDSTKVKFENLPEKMNRTVISGKSAPPANTGMIASILNAGCISPASSEGKASLTFNKGQVTSKSNLCTATFNFNLGKTLLTNTDVIPSKSGSLTLRQPVDTKVMSNTRTTASSQGVLPMGCDKSVSSTNMSDEIAETLRSDTPPLVIDLGNSPTDPQSTKLSEQPMETG